MIDFLKEQGCIKQYAESEYPDEWYTAIDDLLYVPTLASLRQGFCDKWELEAKVNLWEMGEWVSPSPEVTYTVVTALDLFRILNKLLTISSNGLHVTCDIESKNADWNNNELLCIGFCIAGHSDCLILPAKEVSRAILLRLAHMQGIKWIWHNGMFDVQMLLHWYGVQLPIDEDTMLFHYALIKEEPSHKLKDLSVMYLNAPRWEQELHEKRKKWAKSQKIKIKDAGFDIVPKEELYQYNAYDTFNTFHLLRVMAKVADWDCLEVYELLLAAAPVYCRIAQRGMLVDVKYLSELDNKLLAEIEVEQAACRQIHDVNLNSPIQLKEALQLEYPDTEITGTSVGALFDLPQSEFLDHLRAYKKKNKAYNTYVMGIREATCSDGRCRTSFKLHATSSGRLSSGADEDASQKLNFQNIGRDKAIKRVFVAPKGYKLMQFDMSGCELRVLAGLSEDKEMIKIFEEGRDLHGEVAQSIFGDGYTKAHRQIAKTINFGLTVI